jgi:hypothetical protein
LQLDSPRFYARREHQLCTAGAHWVTWRESGPIWLANTRTQRQERNGLGSEGWNNSGISLRRIQPSWHPSDASAFSGTNNNPGRRLTTKDGTWSSSLWLESWKVQKINASNLRGLRYLGHNRVRKLPDWAQQRSQRERPTLYERRPHR